MLTIKAKIIIAYTLVFGLLITGFSIVVYRWARDTRIAELDTQIENCADKMATEIEEDYNDQQPLELTDLQDAEPDELVDVKFQVFDSSGQAIFADPVLAKRSTELKDKAFNNQQSKVTIAEAGDAYRVLWLPIEIDEQIPFVLEVAASTREVDEDLQRLGIVIMVTLLVALFLAGVAAFLITRSAFRPITNMTNTVRSITAHRLDARLELHRANDEVRQLGETLNDLLERIDSAFKIQRQFVADASHEIRTPLSIIRTELEFALRSISNPSERDSLQVSLGEIKRLTRMADQLLQLARLDSSQFSLNLQPVRIDELLVECVRLSTGMAARRGTKISVYVQEAMELQADAEQLKSVILNLLDNAVKYSLDNSAVSATLRLNRSAALPVSIEISDNGYGVGAADLSNLFKRFYRVQTNRGKTDGSGLGLAISKQIIDLHAGRILIESTEGIGSTVTVELPIMITT